MNAVLQRELDTKQWTDKAIAGYKTGENVIVINPEDVTHKKYPVDAIVFNNGLFSVVWGTWDGKSKLLGMRWNTSDPTNPSDVGYPKTFGHPVWFMVPEELTVPILNSLMESEHTNKKAIEKILCELDRGSEKL